MSFVRMDKQMQKTKQLKYSLGTSLQLIIFNILLWPLRNILYIMAEKIYHRPAIADASKHAKDEGIITHMLI